jgi:hypothetical protein
MTAALRGYPLAVEALAHIELDPDSWDQGEWSIVYTSGDYGRTLESFGRGEPLAQPHCSTSFCLAGWANLIGGARHEWVLDEAGDELVRWYPFVYDQSGNRVTASESAAELLQLSAIRADYLFDGDLDISRLYERVSWAYQVPLLQIRTDVQVRIDVLAAEKDPADFLGELGPDVARTNLAIPLPERTDA